LVDPNPSGARAATERSRDPGSNRACDFPAHGFPVAFYIVALRRLRVSDGSTQAMEPQTDEKVLCPCGGFARPEMSTFALNHESLQPPPDVRIHLIKLVRLIARAIVVTPSAQNRIQIPDKDSDVFHPIPSPISQLPNPAAHPLQRPRRRFPVQDELLPKNWTGA